MRDLYAIWTFLTREGGGHRRQLAGVELVQLQHSLHGGEIFDEVVGWSLAGLVLAKIVPSNWRYRMR